MKKYIIFTIFMPFVLVLGLTACNMQGKNETEKIYQQARENFLKQNSYYFDGSTRVQSESLLVRNMVVVNGKVDNKNDVFMNLQLTFPDQSTTDELQVTSRDNKVYTKFSQEDGWQLLSQKDNVFIDEFNNWNPIYHFSQMEQLKQGIENVMDRQPDDDLAFVRVILDPDKLKEQAARELRSQSVSEINQVHIKRLGQKLQINSDQELKQLGSEIQNQSQETKQMTEGIIDSLKIEGEYIVSVDTTSYLPKEFELHLDTQYVMQGEQVRENTTLNMYFRDFNADMDMPDLTGVEQSKNQLNRTKEE